jgi:hypothetical protein
MLRASARRPLGSSSPALGVSVIASVIAASSAAPHSGRSSWPISRPSEPPMPR